jgi:uncharacterized protein YggE
MDDNRVLHVQPPWWLPVTIIVAVLIGGAFHMAGKKMEAKYQAPTTIAVSGEGKASVSPDIAELSFGVQILRVPTAKDAIARLEKEMSAILAAVKKAGIPDNDIRTESLNLNPAYDWRDGEQTMRGFDSMQSLRVKVRDLDKVSDVLAAATNAGANQAGGVSFIVDDPEKPMAEARQKAIEQAQRKAQVLAEQLGMKLGRLKLFQEGTAASPPVMYDRAMGLGAGGGGPPIPSGQQEVQVGVTLTYELK